MLRTTNIRKVLTSLHFEVQIGSFLSPLFKHNFLCVRWASWEYFCQSVIHSAQITQAESPTEQAHYLLFGSQVPFWNPKKGIRTQERHGSQEGLWSETWEVSLHQGGPSSSSRVTSTQGPESWAGPEYLLGSVMSKQSPGWAWDTCLWIPQTVWSRGHWPAKYVLQ